MAHTLFISDLHLARERPAVNRIFHDFVAGAAREAEALYILGDLFEYWAGDDDDDEFGHEVAGALHRLAADGVAVRLMHGNRDFLMGKRLAELCGAQLLSDPVHVDLYGVPTLLMHGDTLCTDDRAYQQFRAQVRDAAWQQGFLSQPLARRKAVIEQMRGLSEQEKGSKAAEIMDVAPAAVDEVLRRHGYPRLIHGHTHRPGRHAHFVDGHECERWVLGDWYRRGSYLRCDATGCRAVEIASDAIA